MDFATNRVRSVAVPCERCRGTGEVPNPPGSAPRTCSRCMGTKVVWREMTTNELLTSILVQLEILNGAADREEAA